MKQAITPVLGSVYTDKVTGFTGTAVNLVYYMVRAPQVGLLPRSTQPNKLEEVEFFDFARIEHGDAAPEYESKTHLEPAPRFQFNDEVRDTITGVKGRVVARCHHLDGCVTYGVLGKAAEQGFLGTKGKSDAYPPTQYISEHMLEVIAKAAPAPQRTTGATHHNDLPPRNSI